MERSRLKAAVEEMTAILQEMQEEANEYDRQRSAWYWEQLEQNHSGLSTIAEFQNETVENYRKLHSDFYIGDLIHRVENLEKRLDFFNVNNAMLQQFKAEAKNRVPAGWKYWEVTYKDGQFAVDQHSNLYAPTPEEAGEKCKKVYTFEHNTIDIIEVKEVGA